MRSERGITCAAIVVMLCCIGGATGNCPIANTNALIASVIVNAHPSSIDERVSGQLLDAPERTSSCILQRVVPTQIEINELQNLPPPAFAV